MIVATIEFYAFIQVLLTFADFKVAARKIKLEVDFLARSYLIIQTSSKNHIGHKVRISNLLWIIGRMRFFGLTKLLMVAFSWILLKQELLIVTFLEIYSFILASMTLKKNYEVFCHFECKPFEQLLELLICCG